VKQLRLLVLFYLARCKTQWGIRDLGDWASFPALFLLISLLAFLATPALNAVSRHFEHEADRYGLEVIHGIVAHPNQVAVHYFEKSGEVNLSDPNPNWFIKMWFYDHPTRPERVPFRSYLRSLGSWQGAEIREVGFGIESGLRVVRIGSSWTEKQAIPMCLVQ